MSLIDDLKDLSTAWKGDGEQQAAGVIDKMFELQTLQPEKLGKVTDGIADLAVKDMPETTDNQKALKEGLRQYAKVMGGQDFLISCAQGK